MLPELANSIGNVLSKVGIKKSFARTLALHWGR